MKRFTNISFATILAACGGTEFDTSMDEVSVVEQGATSYRTLYLHSTNLAILQSGNFAVPSPASSFHTQTDVRYLLWNSTATSPTRYGGNTLVVGSGGSKSFESRYNLQITRVTYTGEGQSPGQCVSFAKAMAGTNMQNTPTGSWVRGLNVMNFIQARPTYLALGTAIATFRGANNTFLQDTANNRYDHVGYYAGPYPACNRSPCQTPTGFYMWDANWSNDGLVAKHIVTSGSDVLNAAIYYTVLIP